MPGKPASIFSQLTQGQWMAVLAGVLVFGLLMLGIAFGSRVEEVHGPAPIKKTRETGTSFKEDENGCLEMKSNGRSNGTLVIVAPCTKKDDKAK